MNHNPLLVADDKRTVSWHTLMICHFISLILLLSYLIVYFMYLFLFYFFFLRRFGNAAIVIIIFRNAKMICQMPYTLLV